jgi:hypothetical protein
MSALLGNKDLRAFNNYNEINNWFNVIVKAYNDGKKYIEVDFPLSIYPPVDGKVDPNLTAKELDIRGVSAGYSHDNRTEDRNMPRTIFIIFRD